MAEKLLQVPLILGQVKKSATGHFELNQDGKPACILSTREELRNNLAELYNNNNPVMYTDSTGQFVLSLIIIGAVVGLIVGGASSIVSQGITNGWDNINWGQVGFDALIGGITGAIGGSGIGMVGSMIAGGILGFVGSAGGDLISNGGDWSKVNWGKAAIMGVVGVGLGAWTGAGAGNARAMNASINGGKSWGAKTFMNFGVSVADRGASQLARQTAALYMANAILGYQVQGLVKVFAASAASMAVGSAMGYFWG